jgi:hypothetical protein
MFKSTHGMSIVLRIPWTRQWVTVVPIYEKERTGAALIMMILARDATVFPCQCWPCPILVYVQKIMMKYGIPETEVTSADAIWQLTLSYHLWETVPSAAWEHHSVLCPNQQYYGISANVYLRAGRTLIRVMIMMADNRVNQTRVVGAIPTTYRNQTHWD